MEAFKINRFSFKRHDNAKILSNRSEPKSTAPLSTSHRAKIDSTFRQNGNNSVDFTSLELTNSFAKVKTPLTNVEFYGLGNLYNVYPATNKEDGKECSLVILETRQIDKLVKAKRREATLTVFRNEPIQLCKIKHSRFLQILRAHEEDGEYISFPIEVVMGSLRSLVYNNQEITEFEIISGIYQITDGLRYLHSSLRMMHCNICPNSIILNIKKQWKIAGLNFLEPIIDTTKSAPFFTGFDENKVKLIQPDLDYIAPEAQLQKSMSQLADMYSLGMVICGIYNNGKSLIDANNDIHAYVRNLTEVPGRFHKIADLMPKNLRDPIRKMISEDIRVRPTSQLFSLLQIFNDPTFLSFEKLMVLESETMNSRKEFFNQFATQIKEYNSGLIYKRIFPALKYWCFHSLELTPFVMPSIITLIRLSDDHDYSKHLEGTFHKILDLYKDPQIGYVLLDLLEFYIERLSINEIQTFIIETLIICLKSDSFRWMDVIEKAAKIIPVHLPPEVHKYLYSRLKEIVQDSGSSVRVKSLCLRCLDIFMDYFDGQLITNEIFPYLSSISDPDSEMLLDILMIYRHMLLDRKITIPYTLIATKLFPPLIPYLCDKNIREREYKILIDTCRYFLDAIDRGKMKELSLEMNSQSGSCSSLNSQFYQSNLNATRVLPLIAMQKPTIDHEGMNRFSDYYGIKSAVSSDTGSQGVLDAARPRSNSSEYYRRLSGEDIYGIKGSCKSILMANRKRASSHCSESLLTNAIHRSGNSSANSAKMPISSSSGRIGHFMKGPISSSIKNLSFGSNPMFPFKSHISNESNLSSLSPRGSVSSVRNRSPSTTSLINQAIERRRYSGNSRYSSSSNNQTSNLGTSQRLSLTNTILDPRRHSYGFSAPSSVHNLITSNVCEGPFISPQMSRFQSRRTSSQNTASRFNSNNLFTSNKN